MMKLLEFYKKVLVSLGLTVTDDNYVKIVEDDVSTLMTVSGVPLVIGTKQHLDSLLVPDDDGKLVVTKLPYNPLKENIVKGNSKSITATKNMVEKQLTHAIAGGGTLLLKLAMNDKMQAKTNMDINMFLMRLKDAKVTGAKLAVDDNTIKAWAKFYDKTYSENKNIFKVYLKKAGTIDNVKYNRIATYNSDLYNELLKADKTTPVWGIKLRPKDIVVFKILLEYLLGINEDTTKIVIGSNDNESPAFIVLYRTYLKLITKTNKVLKSLKVLDQELYDSCYRVVGIKDAELDGLSIYKGELLTMPNELDINRDKVEKDNYNTNSLADTIAASANTMSLPVASTQPVAVNPVQAISTTQPAEEPVEQDATSSIVSKVLYGGGNYNLVAPSIQRGAQPTQQPNQMLMRQQNMYMSNQQAVPMGINSMQQPQQQMVMPQNQMMQQQYNPYQPVYTPQQQVTPMGINSNMAGGYRF